MGQDIQTGVSGDFFRHRHNQVRVNDRYVRGQFVVGQWVLGTLIFVGNNGKGGHFRAGTGGGRDGHQTRFFTQFRELVNALADIQELLGQAGKVGVWLFVEEPHAFGRING